MASEMILRIDRLKSIRKQRGFSQRELARLCNLGETQINKYESGLSEPNVESLKLMAEKLGVSTDYLLGVTDEPRGHVGDGEMSVEEGEILTTFRREGWSGVARLSVERLSK